MKASVFRLFALFVVLARSVIAVPAYQAPALPAAAPSAPKAQADASAATAKTPPAPQPIPISMIAIEAESASARLRRIQHEMDRALLITEEESRLAALTGSLKRFRPLLEGEEMAHLDELLNLRQELKRLSLQLLKAQSDLTPRSQAIEARREELLKMELLWKITISALKPNEAPQATRELLVAVQREIQGALDMIAAKRPALLTLQGKISEQRIAVDNLQVQTDAAINESKARLLKIDSEPLWRAIATSKLSASLMESAEWFYQRRALPLFDYLKDDKELLLAHLLITLLLTLLLSAVSRNSRIWIGSQEEAGNAAQVLRHPVAAAIVLSLLLSFYLYPNAPITLYQLPPLLMVIPLVRLLSEALAREERNIFYFLTGTYLLRRLDELLAANDFVHRISLLVLTGVAIIGIWRAAKADRQAAQSGLGPWRRVRMNLVRLAGPILLGSLIANIVGSVGLSTLLAEACISSAFAGAAIFAGVLTLEGYLIPLLRSPLARISPAIRNYRDLFQRRTSILIRFAALVIWIWLTVGLFGLSEHILALITPVLARQWSLGQMTFSLRGILLFAVTILLSATAARFIGFLIEEEFLTRVTLPQGIPASVSLLVRNSVIVLGFILALTGAGLQWNQIVLVVGAIGVGIGLGLQNLVASFIAGLILIFERPIRVGDAVEIGKIIGVVTRIGLRSSTIQTYDGSEVICPNSNLISQELVNWTLSNQIRRIEVQVGTAYGSDPEKVVKILTNVALKHPGVLEKPEPIALFRGFGDSSLNFALRCFSSFSDWLALSSELGIRINEAFREAGIEIPFPQRDIRITSEPSSKEGERASSRMGTSR